MGGGKFGDLWGLKVANIYACAMEICSAAFICVELWIYGKDFLEIKSVFKAKAFDKYQYMDTSA